MDCDEKAPLLAAHIKAASFEGLRSSDFRKTR
jgi:hypothetical protein